MGKPYYVPPLQPGQVMQSNILSFFIISWVQVKWSV